MDKSYIEYLRSKNRKEINEILNTINREKYPERYSYALERHEQLNKGEDTMEPSVTPVNPEMEMSTQANVSTLKYASVFTRLGAIILDGLIIAPIYIPLTIITNYMERNPEASGSLLIAFFLLFLSAIIFSIWNAIIRMGKTGQSLGRKFLNIAVLNSHGKPIGIGNAFFREVIGRFISGIFCYIGYLNAFWDKDRQMWHDKMAKCYVYYVDENFS